MFWLLATSSSHRLRLGASCPKRYKMIFSLRGSNSGMMSPSSIRSPVGGRPESFRLSTRSRAVCRARSSLEPCSAPDCSSSASRALAIRSFTACTLFGGTRPKPGKFSGSSDDAIIFICPCAGFRAMPEFSATPATSDCRRIFKSLVCRGPISTSWSYAAITLTGARSASSRV